MLSNRLDQSKSIVEVSSMCLWDLSGPPEVTLTK